MNKSIDEITNSLIANSEALGAMRKKNQINGFIRSLIVAFEQRLQVAEFDVAKNKYDTSIQQNLRETTVCLALLRSTLETILEKY